ncbi:MAG: SAM hydrolase/SAM-dependent halogenase family protein [Candidatus Aminicenantia bacterium]
MKRIIALITDFGESDYFVGSIKGVILSINPEAEIIDITHNVKPFDIFEAGFILRSSYKFFSQKTIFVAVVDPEVGSKRRILLAYWKNYFFIAPDNGLLSIVINEEEEKSTVISITSSHYFLPNVSNTFHGRDIMAPVSAWLSKGINILSFGETCNDWFKLKFPEPKKINENLYEGEIIHVDRFGNLITNLPSSLISEDIIEKRKGIRIEIGGRIVEKFTKSYSDGSVGEPVLIIGSSDFLEIGAFLSSAAKILNARRGDKFKIQI